MIGNQWKDLVASSDTMICLSDALGGWDGIFKAALVFSG